MRTREIGAVLADCPVDFIGGGWSDLDVSGRPARVLGATTFDAMREFYPRFSMQRSVQDIHEITMSIAGAAGANLLPAEPVPAGVWTPKQAA